VRATKNVVAQKAPSTTFVNPLQDRSRLRVTEAELGVGQSLTSAMRFFVTHSPRVLVLG
jgi:hypothetical protein